MLRGLIGVVHLPAMPGDPRYAGSGGFAGVERRALADAEALASGGARAVIVENFGSAPFVKGTGAERLPPHQVAAMALIARRCVTETGLPVGVNCLRSDALSALGIAAAAGLDFIRVNVHVGAYVTDQGLIEGEAHLSMRYRDALGARGVRLFADVMVKHASPLAELDPALATHDTLDRGLADGVIVTGSATGAPIDPELLACIREAAGDATLLLGSGVTPDSVARLAPLAHGAIVGSWLKQGGELFAPVDEERVRRLADALEPLLREGA